MKYILSMFFVILSSIIGHTQPVLITSGYTSTGGSISEGVSFDYAVGQIYASSYFDEHIQGGAGILQVIPQPIVGAKSTELLEVTLFPNPTPSELHIELSSNYKSIIRCYDAQGRLVIDEIHQEKIIDISIGEMPSGIYYLTILQDKKIKSFKINKIQ